MIQGLSRDAKILKPYGSGSALIALYVTGGLSGKSSVIKLLDI